MKRKFSVILVLTLIIGVFSILPIEAFAEEELFSFFETEGGYKLQYCVKTAEGEVVLPAEYMGKKVVAIQGGAFEGCEKMTSVVLPETITAIDDYAFRNCPLLESVNIPSGVTRIGNEMFANCTSLKNIELHDNIEYIGKKAFYTCKSLETVKIPAKVKVIYDSTFEYCTNLKNVLLPETVTEINMYAFKDCESLSTINLPSRVIEIDMSAFLNTAIYNNRENWSQGVLYIGAHLICADRYAVPEFYTIKEDTINIASCAFSNNYSLKHITIPKSITKISAAAFWECENLKMISFEGFIEAFGHSAFEETNISAVYINSIDDWCNTSFENESANPLYSGVAKLYVGNSVVYDVVVPENIERIKPYTFANYGYLNSVSFSNNLKEIEEYAFHNCDLLTEVIFPAHIEKIGDCAFNNCDSLSSVSFPEGLKEIGETAFGYCGALSTITLPDSIETITRNSFYATRFYLNESNWENQFLFIGKCLIEAKPDLYGNIVLKDGIKVIANHAFSDCDGIISVDFPSTLEIIGDGAFYSCYSLRSVEIPSNLRVIGNEAFFNTPLQAVVFNDKIESIGKMAFGWCDFLKEISIPDSIKELPASLFADCQNLKTVVLPENLTKISESAFVSCDSLEYVFYNNTEENWNKVIIEKNNDVLSDVKIHFDSVYHDFSGYTVEHPTPEVGGKRCYHCSICGYEYSEALGYLNQYVSNLNTEAVNVDAEKNIITAKKYLIEDLNEVLEAQQGYRIEFSHSENNYCGTGSKIRIVGEDGALVKAYTLIVSGDLNGDSVCDTLDCMLMQLSFNDTEILKNEFFIAADVDENNVIEMNDFQSIVNKMINAQYEADKNNSLLNTEEIVELYKASVNDAKQNANGVVLLKKGVLKYYNIAEANEQPELINKFYKNSFFDDEDYLAFLEEPVTRKYLQPQNSLCTLSVNNIKTAKCKETESEYILNVTVKDDIDSVASLVEPLTEARIMSYVANDKTAFTGLVENISNLKVSYENVKVTAVIDKKSGALLRVKTNTPCIVEADAIFKFIGETISVKLGVELVEEYTIESVNGGEIVDKEALELFRSASSKIKNNSEAGYTKKAWQNITYEDNSDNYIKSVINSLLVSSENAVGKNYEKGSDDVKQNFPLGNCSEEYLLSVTKTENEEGNYIVRIITEKQNNPKKSDIDGLTVMSNELLYTEDVKNAIKYEPFDIEITYSDIAYKNYYIVAEITKSGEFVSVSHSVDANCKMSGAMSLANMNVSCTGVLSLNAEYTDFKY